MWRKQPEVKPSPAVAPGAQNSPSYAPAVESPVRSSAPATAASGPASSSPSSFSSAPSASPDAAVLTNGIRIKGELSGKADLVIDGEVEGSIRLVESRLTIGQSGRVKASIEAREVTVRGSVEGNVRGRERIALGSSSRVKGDLEAPRIAIEDGAKFKGRVEMGPTADAREHQSKRNAPAANASTPAITSPAPAAAPFSSAAPVQTPSSVSASPANSAEPIAAHTKP
ncbi:MAG TPA: polymer-forming cytoskeletal protein [Candidatus Acidoferrales bacterium]|nr:polymer-forming cytoskeletal protein [Candidatus Acidoferrales bacterium]